MVGDDPIRVVIADDHARMRAKIRAALEAGGCEVCGEGASAEDAVRLVAEHRPDAVLLDIHMPGSGIQAAQQIARSAPRTGIVMLTQSREDEDLFDSLRAGASGYLLKDADPATLPAASTPLSSRACWRSSGRRAGGSSGGSPTPRPS